MQKEEAARSESAPAGPAPFVAPPGFTYFVDDIDELSNSVIDLIDEGRLDEAEERCRLRGIGRNMKGDDGRGLLKT